MSVVCSKVMMETVATVMHGVRLSMLLLEKIDGGNLMPYLYHGDLPLALSSPAQMLGR